jgi:hypothetical protein
MAECLYPATIAERQFRARSPTFMLRVAPRAHQRLPVEMGSALTRQTGQLLSQKATKKCRSRGRAVKLVDGTGLSMPDTPQNQAVYPQPSTQAAGEGARSGRCENSSAPMAASDYSP